MRLAINTGSTSKKYAAFDGSIVLQALFEKTPTDVRVAIERADRDRQEYPLPLERYDEAQDIVLKELQGTRIDAVGVRVVAPGRAFAEHRVIDDACVEELREAAEFAPLHVMPALTEIEQFRKSAPSVPMHAISDSAFHRTIGADVRSYAIKKEDSARLGLERFGYHGLAAASVVRKVREKQKTIPSRAIICHVGGGVSIMALKDGKSIDTSMGFSPESGIPMSKRVGDIDAGALLYLAEKKGLSNKEMRRYLGTECGFLGLTGESDLREVLRKQYEGDQDAIAAYRLFVTAIKKRIGAYFAILEGLDAVYLTGTANERNPFVRESVVDHLEHLGIRLDRGKNGASGASEIQKVGAPVAIEVIKVDEMREILEALPA